MGDEAGRGTIPETIDELESRRAAGRVAGQRARDDESAPSRNRRLGNRRDGEIKTRHVVDH